MKIRFGSVCFAGLLRPISLFLAALAGTGGFTASRIETGFSEQLIEQTGSATKRDNYYVGVEVCASCHRANFELQSNSRHAVTWRAPGGDFPSTYIVELEGEKPQSIVWSMAIFIPKWISIRSEQAIESRDCFIATTETARSATCR
ncbi:MAG TPA: hypothetical protein VGK99_04150 [Acidobacteriota bacterium]|jgi:hypothetical protein